MAGFLDDMTPQQYGLLAAGLGILGNSRGQSFGQAVGIGGLQGLDAMAQMQQARQMQQLRDAQEQRYRAMAEREQKSLDQQAAQRQIMSKANPMDKDSLIKAMWDAGMYKDALKYTMPKRDGIPTGFVSNEDGSIAPMPLAGGGNYMDYQLQLANQKAQVPGFGEPERLAIEQRNQQLKEIAAMRQIEKDNREKLKDVPAKQYDAYIANNEGMRKIDEALQALENTPQAFGMKNYLPDAIIQRTDAEGVDPRARVSEIQGVKLHELSGGAVTVPESGRLSRFLPNATDTPESIKIKLKGLRREFEATNEQIKSIFNEKNGFKAIPDAPEWQKVNNVDSEIDQLKQQGNTEAAAELEKMKRRDELRKKYIGGGK